MNLSDDIVVARGRDSAWQVVEDKVVVVTPRSREIHILDGTGGTIWECVEQPTKLVEVVDAVCGEYDVGRETAERETKEFIAGLAEKGIVELSG